MRWRIYVYGNTPGLGYQPFVVSHEARTRAAAREAARWWRVAGYHVDIVDQEGT